MKMLKRLRLSLIVVTIIILLGGVVCGVVFGVLNTTTPPAQAVTLNSGTAYYKNGTSFYTLSNTVTHYRCTNSQHSGSNDYTSSSQESDTCYLGSRHLCYTCGGSGVVSVREVISCPTCDGTGKQGLGTCTSCGGTGNISRVVTKSCTNCGGAGSVNEEYPHNFTVDHYVYTYRNIDTGSTTTSQSAFTRATGYTVTFNNNGGSGTMSSQYFLHGHSQAIKTNTFTRDNYTFLGWSTSSTSASPTYTDGQAVTQITSGSSVTLYAVWEINKCIVTVTYNNNSYGSVVGGGEYDLNALVVLTAIANDGYVFVRWEDSAGSVVSTDNIFTFTVTSNVTYKAIFQKISITITTTTGGGEIVDETTAHNDVAYIYALEFENGKYLNYMLINERQVNINYTTGVITDVPECLGIEYMTNKNASLLYLEVRNLTGVITITLNLVTVEPSLVPASGGVNINGVAVQATYGGSATVLGDNIDEMTDSDTIILSAKIACVGYRFVGWYDANTNQLLSAEMSAKLPFSTVKNKLIEARFEPISQNDINDETDNNFDEFA